MAAMLRALQKDVYAGSEELNDLNHFYIWFMLLASGVKFESVSISTISNSTRIRKKRKAKLERTQINIVHW
jgi:hypothetical protein